MLAINIFSFIGLHIPNFVHPINFIDVVFVDDFAVKSDSLIHAVIVHGSNHKFYLY